MTFFKFLLLLLKTMWLWIFIGLNFISKLDGYSHGIFPEVCDSMRPLHGDGNTETPPQTSESPFMVSYQLGSKVGDPITVSLQSKDSVAFMGFMLEARDLSLDGEGPPLGKFIILDSGQSRLVKCGKSEASAFSNKLNVDKRLIKVNWTSEGDERDIIFRATFSQSFSKYWERVNVRVLRPTSTPKPEPTTAAATTTAEATMAAATTTMAATTTTTAVATTTTTTQMSTTMQLDILPICLISVFEEIKMQISNIIMAVHPRRSSNHDLIKSSRIVGSSFSILSSLSTLILYCLWNPLKGILIGLVSTVLVIGFIEWVIAVLPFGPSHELNEPCELALRVCFPFHHLFTNALLYVRINSLADEWGETKGEFWPLYVLIAHTVLIGLTIGWDIVLCDNKRVLLQIIKDKAKHHQGHQRNKEHVSAVTVTVIVISVILMVGITSLSVALIVALF